MATRARAEVEQPGGAARSSALGKGGGAAAAPHAKAEEKAWCSEEEEFVGEVDDAMDAILAQAFEVRTEAQSSDWDDPRFHRLRGGEDYAEQRRSAEFRAAAAGLLPADGSAPALTCLGGEANCQQQ